MPDETQTAVNQVLSQIDSTYSPNDLVDGVRQYFNEHSIECLPMCFDDLKPYLPLSE